MANTDAGQPPRGQQRPRNGKGRFVRNVDTAARDAEAARLRTRGMSYRQIAEQLGYADESNVARAVRKVLLETVQEAGDELRAVEVARLDAMLRVAWEVMETQHVTVQHGKVVVDLDTGEPLRDHGPTLAAIDRVLKIAGQRAELLGLNAPKKIETDGVVKYVIEGVDLGKLT